jgi:hypothetical protein
MTDAILFVTVIGAVTLALAVDVVAVIGWLRRCKETNTSCVEQRDE